MNIVAVRPGQRFACKYPQHGTRNILCNQVGVVERVGERYVCIKREDGTFRSLRIEKMVEAKVSDR